MPHATKHKLERSGQDRAINWFSTRHKDHSPKLRLQMDLPARQNVN